MSGITGRTEAVEAFCRRTKRNLVGNEWLPAASGRQAVVTDPSTGAPLMSVAESGSEDVDRAVWAARRAFENGPWSKLLPYERSRILLRLVDLLEANRDELARIEAIDSGKPLTQARYVDVPLAIQQFHSYAGLVTKLGGRTITPSCGYMAGTRFHAYTTKSPLGVAGLITPFNFPLLLGAMKLAPALAAGCTVVLKPDERAPASSVRLGELCLEAGIPPGVVNVVLGGPEVGAALAAHQQVDKLAFTGSTEAGRTVLEAAAGNLKKVSLELGGNSPNVIFADANLPAAIAAAGAGAYTNAGECCVSGARVLVQDAVYDQVLDGLVAYARGLKLGPAGDEETQLGPVITEEHLARVQNYLTGAEAAGARSLTGGKRVDSRGYFLEPTVVTESKLDSPFMKDEVFGPVAKVVRFRDWNELVGIANDGVYGLAAGVWTENLGNAHRTAEALKAGTVWVNCYNVFDPDLPFGGYKQSGWSRESCPEALDLYCETKTVCMAI